MFERFTDTARRAIVLAQSTAREMRHPRIEPDHLLIGLRLSEGMAARTMEAVGVDAASLRQRLEDERRATVTAEVLEVPFSAEAKTCLEFSLRAALALGHDHIGSEHLLLGVLREAKERGRSLDGLLGASAAEMHDHLMGALAARAVEEPGMLSPALRSALARARAQAGGSPVTTGDLLLAVLSDDNSHATRALGDLGIDVERVRPALDAVAVASTTDAVELGESVVLTTGTTTCRITDPEVVAALSRLGADELREALRNALALTVPGGAAG